MDQAPIDIRYSELLQWLEDRYQIPKDWPKRLELITVKKKEIFDMFFQNEAAEMKKLQATFKYFQSTPLDTLSYLDYQMLNNKLIKTEAAKDKSLLRNYNNPLIYSSYVLNTIYAKNNMSLAEASKIIIQIIAYDIPVCKKQIADLQRSIQENEGRSAEKEEQIKKNTEKIKSILKSNEIAFDVETTTANQIASSLIDRLILNDELETKLDEIEKRIMGNISIKQALDMYYDFYKVVNGINSNDSDQLLADCLFKIYSKGDYTLNDTNASKPNRKKMIEAKGNRYRLKYSNQDDVKGWNFSIVGDNQTSGSNAPLDSSNRAIKDNETINDSCLLNNKTRELLIADLEEVSIFLQERISNSDNKEEIILMMYHQAFKDYNFKYTIDDMEANIEVIANVLKMINAKDFVFLMGLYNDEDLIKTITETYSEIKIQNAKLRNMKAELKKKNEELADEIKDNEAKVLKYKKTAVGLRRSTEIIITKALKKKITIIGDENLI